MAIPRWKPAQEPTAQEKILLKRLDRVKKLFGFLRLRRLDLFDDAFQAELEGMYRATGAGKEPKPPAMMAMALLLQAYSGASDAEAVELTVMDLRWQMVLGCLGAAQPAFSQGGLQEFRQRMIETGMDQRLLERTVELAKTTKEFDWKKLPKTLRLATDSSPFEGAGRVEDTINLLGHAARKVVECVAASTGREFGELATEAGIPVLLASSIKAGLDVNWSDEAQADAALQRLAGQLSNLHRWLVERVPELLGEKPLTPYIATLLAVEKQDLTTSRAGVTKIRDGVAKDRRISVEDPEMRHGRKSKSRVFNGFKRHVGVDMDTGLIVGCAVTPANQADHLAAEAVNQDVEALGMKIGTFCSDLAYLASPVVEDVLAQGGEVVCKPRPLTNHAGRFSKADFDINMRTKQITCPAGQTQDFQTGQTVHFDAELCDSCSLRRGCTGAARGRGRSVHIAQDEQLQKRLRARMHTRQGRKEVRERVIVEHRLSHLTAKQGRRARYRGVRKNLFDVRRHSAVLNLEVIHQRTNPAK